MDVKEIFLLFVAAVYGYNIDTDFPLIYFHGDAYSTNSTYFGYTVYLYRESSKNASWLIVGAPRSNYITVPEHGIVYRCEIGADGCEKIKPKEIVNEEVYVEQLKMNVYIKKQHGWFGSAMAMDRSNGFLTVCAPRTILHIYNAFEKTYSDTMQGMCYSGNITSDGLSMENEDLDFHNFNSKFWYNPMRGFSIHYASTKPNEDKGENEVSRIIGNPMHELCGTVDIVRAKKRISIELPLNDELSQFGHSVESGCFFDRNQVLYVSGAPGWQYVGQVAILNPAMNSSIVAKLHGTDTGEYFGASLAVGDLNNDGLDDLLVGAPYWGQDNGKVCVYLGTLKGQFEAAIVLQGAAKDGRFGYAIASGDLDSDGFDDIIVGAPWEESGVIYIYNGGPDLKYNKLQASVRIQGTSLFRLNGLPIERFGFSTSKPIDIDGNGYLDIPVGAYKSGYAVILRSKPVIKTELSIRVIPNVLERDAKQFVIRICPRYDGYNMQSALVTKCKITVTVDEQFQRTKETFLELTSCNLTSVVCLETRVNISVTIDPCIDSCINFLLRYTDSTRYALQKSVRDFIEPITIFARHHFVYSNASSGSFCKFCAVERSDNKLNVTQILLPFNIGCGPDTVCNSNVSATARFHGVRDNDVWIIGSTDVSLEVNVKNHGEPSYLTTLEFAFPEGVILHSILSSCQEDTSKENLMVFCEAGNPLWKGEEKNITLDLDMKHLINGSLHGHELYFNVTIKTRSTNQGTVNLRKTLNLASEVSLSLNGSVFFTQSSLSNTTAYLFSRNSPFFFSSKAYEETYHLSTTNNNASNVSFQHTYQVYKLGATPIEDARLVVKIPTVINSSESLVHIYKPQLYVSGERFECFSKNILVDNQLVEVQKEQQSADHAAYKRDVDESSSELYDAENIRVSRTSNESLTTDVLYMNCSTSDVNCTIVVCDLNALKTLDDIGKLSVKLFLNVERLKDISDNSEVVLKFGTEATVEIIKPGARLPINGTRSTIEIVTMFYNSSKTEKLSLWIIIVSVSIGLLLLLVFVAILTMMGFFKRKNKEDLSNNKNTEEEPKEDTATSKSEDK
ncbi:integrin alpha-8-like isoform X2 [Hylaeus anthracinus]|uniref:integrin alpha-8-like isoform X2 n=1 Tax=Hylaeus anthracinus TaxID=313031 RepID=UPI0023B996C3|nr:integrin alpha-8-like isoform X2 [Hylaeus anthracinus]